MEPQQPPQRPENQPGPGASGQPPGQPWPQGPAPSPRKRRTGRWIGVGIGAVVIITAIVLVSTMVLGDGGSGSNDEGQPAAWSISTGQDYEGVETRASTHRNTWVADGALIRAGTKAVQSIEPRSGNLNWETPLPANHSVCHAGHSVGSVAALIYSTEREDQCDRVLMVDVSTGKITQDIPRPQDSNGKTVLDVLAEGVILLSGRPLGDGPAERGTIQKIDGQSGTPIWETPLDDCFDVFDVVANDKRILATAKCRTASSSSPRGPWQLISINPDTGAKEWSVPIAGTENFGGSAGIIANDPPILARYKYDEACCFRQSYEIFDSTGKSTQVIERGNGDQLAVGLTQEPQNRIETNAVSVVGSTLIVGNWADGTTAVNDRQFIGIDLNTGQQKWRTTLPTNGAPELIEPISPGTNVVRIFDKMAFAVHELDTATGQTRQTHDLQNPFSVAERANQDFYPREINGVLVLSPRIVAFGTEAVGFNIGG